MANTTPTNLTIKSVPRPQPSDLQKIDINGTVYLWHSIYQAIQQAAQAPGDTSLTLVVQPVAEEPAKG